jgi:hypothetical protein
MFLIKNVASVFANEQGVHYTVISKNGFQLLKF